MLFNSLAFALFLPLVFALYWMARRAAPGARNLVLLAASYVFYGWWDYRFLALLLVSTLIDYVVARALSAAASPARRKLLLAASLGANLGVLGFFKYFNFFLASLRGAFAAAGWPLELRGLDIVLPVGISFYTFQTLSYTIDVYRGKLTAERNFVAFAAYVAFFPQLVAGPIERATHLLPQFVRTEPFDAASAADGARQMLWGFAKKMVVADNAAPLVDYVFRNYEQLDGVHIAIGVFLFAIQIYCDFSGYSDIAIGCAKLFGFDLMRNFALPYFSRDISEFWSRWHISLSTWFRDYVFIPLGGSRGGEFVRMRNTLAVFLLSGLWHGANWTFVIWGALHALYYLPLALLGRHRSNRERELASGLTPTAGDAVRMVVTFVLVLAAWVFFRANSVSEALSIFARMVAKPLGVAGYGRYRTAILLCLVLLAVEWFTRREPHPLRVISLRPRWQRWGVYYAVVGCILLLGNFGHVPFIYFQF